jgi:hypothetical protein
MVLFTYTGGGLESLPNDRLSITEAIIDADIPEGDAFNETCGLFSGCSNLEKVTFSSPPSVTRIGHNCFRNCTSLKEIVNLENASNLEDIMAFAFAGCASLEEVVLPSVYLTIDDGAFESCEILARINLPPRGCADFRSHIFGAATLIRSFAGITEPAYSDSTVIQFLQSDEYRNSCALIAHDALPDLLTFVLQTVFRPDKVTHPEPSKENEDRSLFNTIEQIGVLIRNGNYGVAGEILSFLSSKQRPIMVIPSRIREFPIRLAGLRL